MAENPGSPGTGDTGDAETPGSPNLPATATPLNGVPGVVDPIVLPIVDPPNRTRDHLRQLVDDLLRLQVALADWQQGLAQLQDSGLADCVSLLNYYREGIRERVDRMDELKVQILSYAD